MKKKEKCDENGYNFLDYLEKIHSASQERPQRATIFP